MTKRDTLSNLPADYLRQLAHHLNGSNRDYSQLSQDDLLDRVSRKLTVNKVDTVIESFEQGVPAVAAADYVTPDGVREIRSSVNEQFSGECLFEVKVGRRRCDIVFPNDIVAVEIKSARDRIDRAVEQVEYYYEWADQVILVYDVNHQGHIPSEINENGIGLWEYRSGSIDMRKPADESPPSPGSRLTWMTHESLCSAARTHNVPVKGGKERIADRLALRLPEEDIRKIFREYLRKRA